VSRAFAGCLNAIVAADAVSGNTHVIEICRQPAGGGVTVVAGVTAGDMRRMFSRGGDSVVTRSAGTKDLGMIDR
jgi:hypothetical protein